jgi:DNA-binding transcriptional regulator YhcF (GntR family)
MVDVMFYTIEKARQHLREQGLVFSRRSFYDFIKSGDIVVTRFSENKRFISEQSLEDFVNSHAVKYKPKTT